MQSAKNELKIEMSDGSDLSELLDKLLDAGVDENTITAKPGESGFLSSGLQDVIQLLIVMGSSGAIAAATTIVTAYLKQRPRTMVDLEINGAKLRVSDANSSDLKEFFSKIPTAFPR